MLWKEGNEASCPDLDGERKRLDVSYDSKMLLKHSPSYRPHTLLTNCYSCPS